MSGGQTSSPLDAVQRYPRKIDMDNVYGFIVGVILLFPWSLVGIMVAGSVWGKAKPSGLRDRR